ncbi:MAG: hypothetical protein ABI488_10455, partial [Polyangiaceae bacterium]
MNRQGAKTAKNFWGEQSAAVDAVVSVVIRAAIAPPTGSLLRARTQFQPPSWSWERRNEWGNE